MISESLNNPLRLMLGWFVVVATKIPPMSVMIAYWMVGAFFMAAKRYAEYREIGDPERAAAYRSSFRYYTENTLLVSMFFYATSSALMWECSSFGTSSSRSCRSAVRWILQLLPVDSDEKRQPGPAPERLYREKGLMGYLVICLLAFVGLMFVQIPALYQWFNVKASTLPSLWTIQ